MGYKQFTISCVECGELTSRAYAKKSDGKCKACATGIPKQGLICPDCGEHTLTAYQKKNGYHCDSCTREADPEGYRREVMGLDQY